MRWARYVARTRESIKTSGWKDEAKRPIGIPGSRGQDIIKMDLRKTG
jgi:hypothetical protein